MALHKIFAIRAHSHIHTLLRYRADVISAAGVVYLSMMSLRLPRCYFIMNTVEAGAGFYRLLSAFSLNTILVLSNILSIIAMRFNGDRGRLINIIY